MADVMKFRQNIRLGQDLQDKADNMFGNFHIGGWMPSLALYTLNFAVTHCLEGDEQYLEIGVFGGRSLIGALTNNDKRVQAFDPFTDGDGVRQGFLKNIKECEVVDRVTLHNMSCHDFDGELPPIGVFLYDGNHDSGHTYEGLKRFEKYLSNQAIIIVDDYDIIGGDNQSPYPGYDAAVSHPVRRDTDEWMALNKHHIENTLLLPGCYNQMIILYNRDKS